MLIGGASSPEQASHQGGPPSGGVGRKWPRRPPLSPSRDLPDRLTAAPQRVKPLLGRVRERPSGGLVPVTPPPGLPLVPRQGGLGASCYRRSRMGSGSRAHGSPAPAPSPLGR